MTWLDDEDVHHITSNHKHARQAFRCATFDFRAACDDSTTGAEKMHVEEEKKERGNSVIRLILLFTLRKDDLYLSGSDVEPLGD
jgi:hypothetical protein